jgi:thioredoxin 1
MKKNRKHLTLVILGVLVALAVSGVVRSQFFSGRDEAPIAAPAQVDAKPAQGRVTMIDLGATECVPCKMMAPIIEALKKEYAGRADIIFIDVWKNPGQAKKYGIRAIPTQIFFDAAGKEVHRNVGFMDKKRIVDVLTRLGVS